jgi:protoporphyrinogen oxidase
MATGPSRKNYRCVILGAGVSGLASAYLMAKEYGPEVLVLEKAPEIGGLGKTFSSGGNSYDMGSHRIHSEPLPEAFSLIREVAAENLLRRPRGGKLRLRGKYIDYPLRPADFFRGIGLSESTLCAASLVSTRVSGHVRSLLGRPEEPSYESRLVSSVGRRAYRHFYEPYAMKVWCRSPREISQSAAKNRLSTANPLKAIYQSMRAGKARSPRGFYYYIDGGIGRLAEGLAERVSKAGGEIATGVSDFRFAGDSSIVVGAAGEEREIRFDRLISTIPLGALMKKASFPDPGLDWTGIKLVLAHRSGEPLMPGETFYFPELDYSFGRVSIPKRYSERMQERCDYTAYSCEIPCRPGSALWSTDDQALIDRGHEDLVRAGVVDRGSQRVPELDRVLSLGQVYPIYVRGWEARLQGALAGLSERFPRVYSSGKLGLFLHCNLDHAIEIGLRLARHVLEGGEAAQWHSSTSEFHALRVRD